MTFGKTRASNTFERAEVQPALELAVDRVLQGLGTQLDALDIPHTRRTIRALVRIAARIARARGCDVRTFVMIALHCFESEDSVSTRAQA